MSTVNSTTQIQYRQLADCQGYRFGSDGSIDSCWTGGGSKRHLSDRWRTLKLKLVKGRRYLTVNIRRGDRRFKEAVHVLILEAFSGPAPPGMECRHKDDDALNNRIENLVWGTRFENMEDRRQNGFIVRGETQWKAKLTEDDVREIRRRHAIGDVTLKVLADEFGVRFQTIHDIIKRRRWNHVV